MKILMYSERDFLTSWAKNKPWGVDIPLKSINQPNQFKNSPKEERFGHKIKLNSKNIYL